MRLGRVDRMEKNRGIPRLWVELEILIGVDTKYPEISSSLSIFSDSEKIQIQIHFSLSLLF